MLGVRDGEGERERDREKFIDNKIDERERDREVGGGGG
jgi:hypothetical protein